MQSKVELLGVSAVINERSILYMIDSGATNNFMSVSTCNDLGLKYNTNNEFYNVRLADGKTLKVLG